MFDLTIAYITNRHDPKFEWFAQSLVRQIRERKQHPKIQVIVIDFESYDEEKRLERHNLFTEALKFDNEYYVDQIDVMPPKPTVWQGPHRLTTRDYFAASNARNTALVYARAPYVVFCDDLAVLMPGWLDNALHAASHRYVVCGAYAKVHELEVTDGLVSHHKENPAGKDSRWERGSASGAVPCHPGDLFGCSFGAPMAALLAINGLEERCDSMGGEDSDLGIRLQRYGMRLFYNRNMLTWESDELHSDGPVFLRIIKPLDQGRIDSSHVMLRSVLNEEWRMTPLGPQYDLLDMRIMAQQKLPLPVPTAPAHHWPDNQPLVEM